MPRKINDYRSSGEKIISLFARLLFSREKHSLIELTRHLDCSKQTVIKNINEIRMAYSIDIEESLEGRRRYYQIKKPYVPPQVSLTGDEISTLFMCRAFTEHMLGRELFQDSLRAVEKSMALLPKDSQVSAKYFGSIKLGRIDYTPYSNSIQKLIEAMNSNRDCAITYRSAGSSQTKTLDISPMMIFSFNEALYLHGLLSSHHNTKPAATDFNPTLAIHRIEKVEITEQFFQRPENYDFEKHFNERFGIMQNDPFTVTIEFSKITAAYVAERVWSRKQTIKMLKDGRLQLTFEAGSGPEVIAKILSFGGEAKALEPEWLVEKLRDTISQMANKYGATKPAGHHQ
ncbi:MAG: WYL domain-containing protein [Desulfobulbaceae bacterium]|nr:WYL domain-containing protein [Desulfobulbaceae bacterium]